MPIPLQTKFCVKESNLYKTQAMKDVEKLIDFTQSKKNQKMVRQSSIDSNNLINLFSNMLSCLNMRTGEDVETQYLVQTLMGSNEGLNKSAVVESTNKSQEIKIASKAVKDSHYDIDISKDVVTRNNQKIFMVSCYMRDAYLGRYIIKRNYLFTYHREEAADRAYDEISLKMNSLKDRYYNGVIKMPAITTQAKIILDGVISEIKMAEDSIGTTVKRHPYENNS